MPHGTDLRTFSLEERESSRLFWCLNWISLPAQCTCPPVTLSIGWPTAAPPHPFSWELSSVKLTLLFQLPVALTDRSEDTQGQPFTSKGFCCVVYATEPSSAWIRTRLGLPVTISNLILSPSLFSFIPAFTVSPEMSILQIFTHLNFCLSLYL